MNERLDVSIVTPSYQRAALLPRVWASLKDQTPTFEWIVVDDGSQDNTEQVLAGLMDPRIMYRRLPRNRGTNAARNTGAALAQGRYVVFLDSDDELYPRSMARMCEILDRTDESIGVAMFLNVIHGLGRPIVSFENQIIFGEREILCHQVRHDMICIYRREVLSQFSLPEDIRGCEYLFLCDISRRYKFLLVPESGSIVHRQHDNLSNASSVVARSRDMAIAYHRILDRHADALQHYPSAIHYYLVKAMYRYAVAGDRSSCLQTFRRLAASKPGVAATAKGIAVIALSYLGADKLERWRIHRLNRRFS